MSNLYGIRKQVYFPEGDTAYQHIINIMPYTPSKVGHGFAPCLRYLVELGAEAHFQRQAKAMRLPTMEVSQ